MGSMKWIHDECLKTWIISKGQDLQKAGCELCMTPFSMKFTYKMKFYPRLAIEEGVMSLFSCVCLTFMIAGLVTVIVLITSSWNFSSETEKMAENPSKRNNLSFKLAIVVACSIISGILLVLVIVAIREAFFILEVNHWKILPPDLSKPLMKKQGSLTDLHEGYEDNLPRNQLDSEQQQAQQSESNGTNATQNQQEVNNSNENMPSLQTIQMDVETNTVKEINDHSNYSEKSIRASKDLDNSKLSDAYLMNNSSVEDAYHQEHEIKRTNTGSIKLESKIDRLNIPHLGNISKVGSLRSSVTDDWQQSDMQRYLKQFSNRTHELRQSADTSFDKVKDKIQIIQYEEFRRSEQLNIEAEASRFRSCENSNPLSTISTSFADKKFIENNTAAKPRPMTTNLGERPTDGYKKLQKGRTMTHYLYQEIPKKFIRIDDDNSREESEVFQIKIDSSGTSKSNTQLKAQNIVGKPKPTMFSIGIKDLNKAHITNTPSTLVRQSTVTSNLTNNRKKMSTKTRSAALLRSLYVRK